MAVAGVECRCDRDDPAELSVSPSPSSGVPRPEAGTLPAAVMPTVETRRSASRTHRRRTPAGAEALRTSVTWDGGLLLSTSWARGGWCDQWNGALIHVIKLHVLRLSA